MFSMIHGWSHFKYILILSFLPALLFFAVAVLPKKVANAVRIVANAQRGAAKSSLKILSEGVRPEPNQ